MKKQLTFIIACIFITMQTGYSQTPQGMNYQSIARNAAGAILANQNIGIRFTITDGNGGTTLYRETHNTPTNQFGLFSLNVGSGTPVTGTFSGISWASVTPWLTVDMDPAGGTAYVNMGSSQLLSVPYALMAKSVETGSGWGITGNGGTTPGINFIGTSDNKSLVLKTNSVISGTIDPDYPHNTSLGYITLQNNTTGSENVAIGSGSMNANTNGNYNTAVGALSLSSNDESYNTAIGHSSLNKNTTGYGNTATGYWSLKANTSGQGNTANGYQVLVNNISGNYNTALGTSALFLNTTGIENTAIGDLTLASNTTGNDNTTVGNEAMRNNLTGNSNVAIGTNALFSNTDRSNLVAIGDSALYKNGVGATNSIYSVSNTAIGSKALFSNTLGSDNTACGFRALYNNIDGFDNTALGSLSLTNNSTGQYNVAIGSQALYFNTNGINNVANGYAALKDNTSGFQNTAVGYNSLWSNTSGADNTGLGMNALNATTTGFQNTSIGSKSLLNNTTGSYNTALGYNTGPNGNNYENTTSLGIDATATASNMVRIGNTFVTSIGGYQNWTNISDGRFKENVRENVPGLDFIKQLRPVTYQLNRAKINDFNGVNESKNKIRETDSKTEFLNGDKYSEVTTGFIAQEVEVAAEKSGFNFSGVDAPKNDKDIYGLRYAEFVVPLVKAVQELSDENNLLKKELENMHLHTQQIFSRLQAEIDQLKQHANVISSLK